MKNRGIFFIANDKKKLLQKNICNFGWTLYEMDIFVNIKGK